MKFNLAISLFFLAASAGAQVTGLEAAGGFETKYTYARHLSNEARPIPCDFVAFTGDDKPIPNDSKNDNACTVRRPAPIAVDTTSKNCLADQQKAVNAALLSKDNVIREVRNGLLFCQWQGIEPETGYVIHIELDDLRAIKPVTEKGAPYTLSSMTFEPELFSSFTVKASLSATNDLRTNHPVVKCNIQKAEDIIKEIKKKYNDQLKAHIRSPAQGCATAVLAHKKPLNTSEESEGQREE